MIFLIKAIRQVIAFKKGKRYIGRITWDHTVAKRVYVNWRDDDDNECERSFSYVGKPFSSDDIVVYGYKKMASCGKKTIIDYFIWSVIWLIPGIYFTFKCMNIFLGQNL